MSHITREAAMAAIVGVLVGLIPVFSGAPELAPLVGWAVAAGVS